mgnify:FL=1
MSFYTVKDLGQIFSHTDLTLSYKDICNNDVDYDNFSGND